MKFLKDENERLTLLSFSTNFGNYSKTVSTTWEVSYQSLLRDVTTAKAARLLSILGFLEPAGVSETELHSAHETKHGRIREKLVQHVDVLKNDLDFKRSVDTLIAMSLVEKAPKYHSGERQFFLSVHPLVHEWTRVRLRHQHDGTRLTANMVTLSHAISLQEIASIDKWDVQDYSNLRNYENTFGYHRLERLQGSPLQNQSTVDVQTISIETVILLSLNFVWLPRKPSLEKELLPIASSIMMTGQNKDSPARGNHLFLETEELLRMLPEYLDPRWCSSNRYWSNITKMGAHAIDGDFRPYIECLIEGIRCLNALAAIIATEISGIGPSSARVDSSYFHKADSKFWQRRLYSDLENFAARDKISQLFVSWNLSHNALPEALEANWEFTWYRYFCRSHSFLLATVNGVLWPQYLRIQLYPQTENFVPYHVRDLYYALHHPMVGEAWEWQATSNRVVDQRERLLTVVQTQFTRYFKAGCFIEAEKLLVDYLDTYEYRKCEDCGPLDMVVLIVAEIMQYRG